MISLSSLQNTSRPKKRSKRVGRGPGCGLGKTCGRGEKGAGARSGYKRRLTYEGGQFRLFMKLPERGFNNTRFQRRYDVVNLGQIDAMYEDGEEVSLDSLYEKGFVSGPSYGIKVLGHGDLTKKVTIRVSEYSDGAREKLKQSRIDFAEVDSNGDIFQEQPE